MKAADEPAYLTVGTDVSAKYRGAFCEAKIKTVKRLVKVKVTLKGESTSQVVQDDQVKGPLRVGSTVEVKTNEGLSSEAVISKLTDASLYTVVFDDGDEKTLRRTSLCLKGERHFAESETLDQLPLTNPEHFGTPVIGKKSNRGGRRSSQAVADEENESSSSEDEEEDRRRLNDELLGKVCSIENEEEPSSWYLALVVSPSCNDELLVKKDQCLVRAFSDSKFYTVARRHVHIVGSVGIAKSEFSSRRGFEAAQMFLSSREVPDIWKMDMSQILDSSSSDDEDDEEEKESDDEEEGDEEKKKKHIKEEPDEEPDPEERDHFLQQLYKFMEDRGTPINKPPVLGYKDLNLFKLFRLVYHLGGCHKIESGTVWKQVYMDLGIPVLNSAASYNVKTAYRKYLYGFEEYCRSASITFRTIHHNNPRPPTVPTNQNQTGPELKEPSRPPLKVGTVDDKMEEAESDSESEKEEVKERQLSPRGRRRCVVSQVKMERESPSRPEKRGGGGEDIIEEQREMRRRSNRRMDDSEKGSEEEDEEDEDEEEEVERRRGVGSEDEEDEDSLTGTKVRVKYGRGKTQKIYEAHIKKTDVDNGEQFYLVHYYGWNVRYDEWVKADRIIWPVEKGTKKRQRKKVKQNKEKDESEKERDKDEEKTPSMAVKPTGAKRGRPQIRTTPTGSTGRSVSKTPSSEGRSNGRRTETPSNMANGDNTPRRRTRRTSGMYDSDRASNDQSGSSSEDSESEDPPDKKLSPWRGRSEAPPCQEEDEEEVKQQQQQEEEEEAEEVAEDIEAADVTKNTNDNTADTTTASQMPTATAPPCPSMPQEKADKVLSQSEKKEAEQGEEPAGEAAMLPVQLDKENKMSPEQVTSTGQEVLRRTSPSRMSPQADKTNKMSPATAADKHKMSPEKSMSSPQADPTDEDRSAPLSSPRVKGRRSIFREAGSETPTRILLCSPAPAPSPSHMAALSSPPRSVLKRQDEPMVVLHCLPSQRIPPESPADSDTDSATEEEEEEEAGLPEERSSLVLKRKAVEQRAGDKKLRPDRKEEVAALKTLPPKMATDVSPVRRVESERRSEGVLKAEEWPLPAEAMQREVSEERLTGVAAKEPEVLAGTTPTTVEAPGPAPTEEAEPQIGPEALVCHEVDLDDPDDKEKPSPTTSPEHLLLMMREQQPAPPPLPNLLHTPLPSPHLPQPQVRPFLPAATPSSAPCLEELHPARSTAEEERGATRGEQEGDSSPGFDGSASSSTSTSLLSLQDNKDRGQKRVMDCNLSPTAKKQKRNQKRPHTPGKVEKNGAGHSSDSEDQSRVSSVSQKSQKSRCPALSSPSSHKDKHNFSPQRTYKWTFQLDELDSMSSTERISFLQEKLQEIRKYYMTLKSEVASIDRRRKRLKKKEREVSNTTASTSSGSSDTAMSPSSASPTQNTVAVECR
ncbi:AT-rich interactive domain-containing protein 4A isoform X1 [Acanthopagrus latus]|uniref:AT-rich interactive domain-containing protein 4A isoform X1 n=1 Tax=Acanthopagrus latus TaxID=8177 RepID=UPI00187CCBA5|nr:AT-rich interactive domain-containing protein 4A isoform X1 [Acanthopagrus latus]XP_036926994.1 AT-rich interactive domain-containing protein 4A isoform X1 [Acanthopagrus latus]